MGAARPHPSQARDFVDGWVLAYAASPDRLDASVGLITGDAVFVRHLQEGIWLRVRWSGRFPAFDSALHGCHGGSEVLLVQAKLERPLDLFDQSGGEVGWQGIEVRGVVLGGVERNLVVEVIRRQAGSS